MHVQQQRPSRRRRSVPTFHLWTFYVLCAGHLLTSGQCAVLSASSSDPLHSVQVKVAQCRAQCLDKFTWTGWTPSDTLCQETPDCFMCWESCDLLNQNFVVWGSMCDRKDICFPGCQQACNFYIHGSIASDKPSSVSSFTLKFTKPIEFGVRESSNSLTLSWAKPETSRVGSSHENNVVYVVLRRARIASEVTKWQQVSQTSERTAAVEAGTLAPSATVDFKVIAVTGAGMAGQLVTSYHVASGGTMPQDGGNWPPLPTGQPRAPPLQPGQVLPRWKLHLMALTHNVHLGSVDAVVTWASPGFAGNFLVTWEVKDGTFAITGHLYTDSTTVSLTLWPDTVYSIQVELVSGTLEQAVRSEPLTVDTTVVSRGHKGRPGARLLDRSAFGKECTSTLVIAAVTAGVSVVVLLMGLSLVIHRCKRGGERRTDALPDIEFNNNNGLKRSGAIRRKLSSLSINPVDIEAAVLSPRPYISSNPSSEATSSLDERLSAFRAFLENVEKMASETLSPKSNNNTLAAAAAFPLPPDEIKVSNGNISNLTASTNSRLHLSTEVLLNAMEDEDGSAFQATPATEKLIKKNARRSMSTAI